MSPEQERGAQAGVVAALLTLVLFAFTSTPGLAWFDGGDFTTAAAELGVGHPTGFPSYTLIGHLATLIPVGSVAGRLAWLSALTLAMGAYAMTRVIDLWASQRDATRGVTTAAAWVVPMSLWAIPTVAIHGQVPEVYAGNVAIAAVGLWTALRAQNDARYLALTGLWVGLGLTHHVLFALFGPLLLVTAAWPYRRQPRTLAAVSLLVGTLGLAYAYLVAAAVADPRHNWGDPSTLPRLVAHMTGASIRGAFADEMLSGPWVTWLYLRQLIAQLAPTVQVVAGVGVVGLGIGTLRRIPGARVALALVLSDLAYSVLVNPMGIRDLQCGQVSSVVLVVAGVATLLGAVAQVAARRALATQAVVATGAVLVFAFFVEGASRADDWSADDVLATHLGYAAPESVTAPLGDAMTGATIYGQVILQARPDSAFFGRSLVSDGRWIADWAAAQPLPLAAPEVLAAWAEAGVVSAEDPIGARFATIVESQPADRAIYWGVSATQMEVPDGYAYLPAYPLGELRPVADPALHAVGDRIVRAAQQGWGPSTIDGPDYRRWLADQHSTLGAMAYRARQIPLAQAHFARAVELAPSRPAHWTNLGVTLAAQGDPAAALEACREALAVDRLSLTALRNGIRYAEALGDTDTVEAFGRRLERLGGDRD